MTASADPARLLDVPNFRRVRGTRLFRSSRLDDLSIDGVRQLNELGIRSIVDLRSPRGWEDEAAGPRLIDHHFTPLSVKFSSWVRNVGALLGGRRIRDTTFTIQNLPERTPPKDATHPPCGQRLFVNLIDKEFALGLLRHVVPWYWVPWIILLMLSFLLCRTRLFLREFARVAMNPIGIVGQYTGVVTHCGQAVHAALSLLSQPSQVPSVICCAQGKDRTGIICVLVMAVCGATRQELVDEYARSEEHLKKMAAVTRNYTDSYYLKPEFGTARATTMEQLLDFIDKEYGSIPAYLESIGFGHEQQQALRQLVMQPETETSEG